ncbi:MAG: hypothetical protein HC896_10645 [Bacteroidales bacterium]|nr:hypothetical protein [Bacteroidales bacterium]
MNKPYINIAETVGSPPDRTQVMVKLREMADRILNKTSYKFVNKLNGDIIDYYDALPTDGSTVLHSGFNDWKYWNGVVNLSMLRLSETTGDAKYRDYVIRNYNFAFKHLPFFKALFNKQIENSNFHSFLGSTGLTTLAPWRLPCSR